MLRPGGGVDIACHPATRKAVIALAEIRELRERAEQLLNQARELRDRL
jgi:hypothetical protein